MTLGYHRHGAFRKRSNARIGSNEMMSSRLTSTLMVLYTDWGADPEAAAAAA